MLKATVFFQNFVSYRCCTFLPINPWHYIFRTWSIPAFSTLAAWTSRPWSVFYKCLLIPFENSHVPSIPHRSMLFLQISVRTPVTPTRVTWRRLTRWTGTGNALSTSVWFASGWKFFSAVMRSAEEISFETNKRGKDSALGCFFDASNNGCLKFCLAAWRHCHIWLKFKCNGTCFCWSES